MAAVANDLGLFLTALPPNLAIDFAGRAAMRDFIAILKGAFAGGLVSHEGEVFSVT